MICKKDIQKIELRDIAIRFENKRELFAQGLSVQIPTQKVVWLHGPPGSGKSVIAKLLAGLIAPTRGEYRINDEVINQMTFEEFLPYRVNMGYCFDFGGLIHNRTISQNLSLPLDYHRPEEVQENQRRLEEYLSVFRLTEFRNERPSGVNGGVRKATLVARALVMEPEMLLLDDPSTGLRGEFKKDFQKHLLKKFEQKVFRHIVIATEDAEFMKAFDYHEINLGQFGHTVRGVAA